MAFTRRPRADVSLAIGKTYLNVHDTKRVISAIEGDLVKWTTVTGQASGSCSMQSFRNWIMGIDTPQAVPAWDESVLRAAAAAEEEEVGDEFEIDLIKDVIAHNALDLAKEIREGDLDEVLDELEVAEKARKGRRSVLGAIEKRRAVKG